jgi:hypothetical protein
MPYEVWKGDPDDTRPVTLVTGATGGVGRRVVGRLLARGDRVRALVRDMEKARTLLSSLPRAERATLEVVAADLSQPRTVRKELFAGVRAVVSCASVKVQPKEGDNDRSKCVSAVFWRSNSSASFFRARKSQCCAQALRCAAYTAESGSAQQNRRQRCQNIAHFEV